jgi:multidrug efflux pump
MVYPGEFFPTSQDMPIEREMRRAFAELQRFNKPVVPMLQAHDASSAVKRLTRPEEITAQADWAMRLGAAGITYFRTGTDHFQSSKWPGFAGIQVKDWKQRQRATKEILTGDPAKFGADGLYAKLSAISGVQAYPQLPPPLPGAGNFDVEYIVTSTDEAEQMAPIAGQLIGAAFASGKFLYADSDLKLDLPQTKIVINRDKVADMGLDLASVSRDLAILLSGGYTNRFNYEGRSYKVIPQVEDAARSTPDQIKNLKVRAGDGGLVSVSSIVDLKTNNAPRALTRFQQRNSFKVFGVAAPGVRLSTTGP